MDKIERALEIIQVDLKEFYKDLTRLKEKAGIPSQLFPDR